MEMQGVSKGALQWYSKRYSVASVTKTFTIEGEQTILSFNASKRRLNFNGLHA
jgi:hypothetical protein